MGESLNLRRRVSDEGRKIVKLFSGILKHNRQQQLCVTLPGISPSQLRASSCGNT